MTAVIIISVFRLRERPIIDFISLRYIPEAFYFMCYNILMDQNNEHKLTKQEKWEARHAEKQKMKTAEEKKKISKNIIMWSSVVLGIALVIFGMVKLISSSVNQPGITSGALPPVTSADWIQGNPNATTTLIEYSDFQCPACGAYYPVVKQLVTDFGQNIRLIYRHFPLSQHMNAMLAAEASEAAGKQGKFWEMHDLLFGNQQTWSDDTNARNVFIGYAESLGLNSDQFKKDIDAPDIKAKIESEYNGGLAIGIDSTPTFFLNGVKIQNPTSYEGFKSIIQQAINGTAK